ncbi:MAG: NAD(P)H-binding protein [Nocardioides sp.]|uniref:NAD(P)-dependent oxidoreductase n=1 Tax=Nocardioides sp. TaxID=35761 RepID=UPI0039E3BD16
MTTFAVFGANGYTGDAIRTEALRRGHDVLAYSRSGELRDGAQPGFGIAGSLLDPAVRAEALEKADILVIAFPARELDGEKLKDHVVAILAEAAKADVRVGVVGGSGSLEVDESGTRLLDTEGFPPIALPEAQSHAELLEELRGAPEGDWFYLSPAAVFGAHAPQEAIGSYLVGGDVMLKDSRGQAAISAPDYALAFVDEVEEPKHHNQRFSVIGAY